MRYHKQGRVYSRLTAASMRAFNLACQAVSADISNAARAEVTQQYEVCMSIYATLWQLKFPRDGDDYLGCEWITVTAQGVPPHIGSPTPGCGYEDGDPYAAFLPPPVHTDEDGDHEYMRAVVLVTEDTLKGTERSPQEYVQPLLVLTGEAYATITFDTLYTQICDALRGDKPRVMAQYLAPGGRLRILFEDGTSKELDV